MRHRRWFDGDEDPGTDGVPARIVEHHPDAICIHQDGVLVFANPAAARLLGAGSVRELKGLEISRFIPNRSLVSILARLTPLRRPGDVSSPVSATMHRVDGSAFQTEAVSVLSDWHGRVAYQLTFRGIGDHSGVSAAVALQATLVENANDAVIAVTRSGMVIGWNPAAERVYRRPPEHALAQPVEKALGATVALADIVRNGGVVHATHLALDGTTVNVRMSVSEFDDGYAVLCCEESEDQRSNRNLRTVVDALQEGVVLIGQNRRPFSINPAARDILGLDGRGVDDLALLAELAFYDVDGEPLSPDQHPVEATFRTGLPTLGRLIGIDRADGSRAWLMASFQLFHPERPATSPQLVSFIDFTAQRATTERLAYRAAHDVLTDLPNRAHLMETVGTLLRNGTPLCAVLFIDLDDLKTVNDTLGHDIGDVVIRTSAQRLRDVVRKRDIVGRFSGDEFVVLLVGSFEDEDVDAMVTRIRHALTRPLEVNGATLTLGASIGAVRIGPGDTRDPSALLRDADGAMYADKGRGRRQANVTRPAPDDPEPSARCLT